MWASIRRAVYSSARLLCAPTLYTADLHVQAVLQSKGIEVHTDLKLSHQWLGKVPSNLDEFKTYLYTLERQHSLLIGAESSTEQESSEKKRMRKYTPEEIQVVINELSLPDSIP
jgi:hypothetical protein